MGPEIKVLTGDKAHLPGYEMQEHKSHWWPYISATEGRVAGELLDGLSSQAIERLEFFAKGLGLDPAKVLINHDGQMLEATCPMPTPCGSAPHTPWQFESWKKHWGQQALWIVEEAMGYFGQITGDALNHRMPMISARAAARWAARAGAPARIRSALPADRVEIIAQSTPHSGFFLTREYQIRHPGFDGMLTPPLNREVFVASDAAIILPYDPVHDRVLLVEQFRMGPFGRGDPLPWMLEPVAGRVDLGEDPAETARRECLEEAGLTLSEIEHIASYYCSPGCSTEYFHCYLGLCDLPELKQGRGGLASEHEDIRTHVLDFERAMELIPSGEANNGPLILSLIWLARERDRLRNCA
jgi:nudix-type nucleoside diphosphatase (YffH/AdpP family)